MVQPTLNGDPVLVFLWLWGLLYYYHHPADHLRAFLVKDVIHTLRNKLFTVCGALSGEDYTDQMGNYSLSGRWVEHFSCSESFLSAVQPAVLWAIFKFY